MHHHLCTAQSHGRRWCWCWCHRRLPASLVQPRRHFPLLFELIDGAEASSGLSWLLLPQSLTDAPLSADAPARSAPLLKLRLNPSSHVGFSMYGCARKKDAVGWPKTEWNKKTTLCCGYSRRRNQRILAIFWMGRGFNLCGRRVWIAEVRRGSSDLFFTTQHSVRARLG